MSTKENTLQLPTEFSSTSSSESESETEYSNLKKRRKHCKENEVPFSFQIKERLNRWMVLILETFTNISRKIWPLKIISKH